MKTNRLLTFLLLSLFSLSTFSQDRLFTYTYQSNVLNKGQREIEVWNTFRTGRENYFARLDHRTEFEFGLGKNLQTAVYLNMTTKSFALDKTGITPFVKENEFSISNEWKYKLLDPIANGIGLALYGEAGIGVDEYELECKIIADKKIGDFTVATNAIYELELEPEYEMGSTELELDAEEHKADLNLSAAYSINPNFSLTAESAFRNVIAESSLKHSAVFGGVGVSYNSDNLLLNFTVLPQLYSLKGNSAGQSLNLNEFEKVELRLLLSYVL